MEAGDSFLSRADGKVKLAWRKLEVQSLRQEIKP